ncbi:MAG: PTS transporter subunit EIIC [Bulleidia sp.]
MSKDTRFDELADHVVDLTGGKENIEYVTHCVSRLRINVRDTSAVKTEEIRKIPGVVGVQWSGKQLQIIIGQAVEDAYRKVLAVNHLPEGGGSTAVREPEKKTEKKNPVIAVLDIVAGCITPVIPGLIAGGFFQILIMLATMAGWLDTSSSTYTVLSFVGNTPFYFLPIFVGGYTARKLGGNQTLGMIAGAILLHPNFVSALSEGSLTIFSLPIYSESYGSSIFPALLTVAVMVPIEKFFAKHSPDSLRSILEPFLTLLVIVPIELVVTAPLGSILGIYVSTAIMWIYNTIGFIGVAVVACLWPLLVMTGMHHALVPYILNSFATLGYEAICETAMIISNIDQGAACLAVAVKTKDRKLKSTAFGCSITAMIGGVTEPGFYGVTFPLRTPLYCAMAGTFVGALVAGIGGAAAYSVAGSTGLLGGLPVYIAGGISNLLWMVGGVATGIVLTFILTMIFYKPAPAEEEAA